VDLRKRMMMAAALCLLLLAAACGGGDPTGQDDAGETPGDATGGETTPAEGDTGAAEGGVVLVEEVDTGELYGIGVPQDSTNLQQAINAQLHDIIADGTYEQIYSTWFEGDVPQQLQDPGEPTEVPDGELELANAGRIVVGSDIAFEPFEFIADDEIQGFDIDLMNEIASRLDLEVEYVNTSFDTIFTQLASGQFDAIISAITITEERQQTIAFSNPYFAANQGLAAMAGTDITGVADLAGLDVAVQAGTTGLDYANDNFTDSNIVEFPTSEAAFTALRAGQVDAVFIDLPVVATQVEAG
jgi:ABC-type amino acid transport substrate-binding protein